MRMGFQAVFCFCAVFLEVLASQACVSTVPIPYLAGVPVHAGVDYATVWGTYLYQYSAVRRRNIAVYRIPIFNRPRPVPVAEIPQPCQTCRPRTTTFSSKPSRSPTYQLGVPENLEPRNASLYTRARPPRDLSGHCPLRFRPGFPRRSSSGEVLASVCSDRYVSHGVPGQAGRAVYRPLK